MPKISVIMPAYNSEKYIAEAIESILSQTFTDFEFIIIDDGSTDRTVEIISRYNDSRIRFYQNENNMGVAATLNRGLDLATGEYIARMDSDDISLPDRFKKQIEYLEKRKEVAVCGTDLELFGVKYGKFIHSTSPKTLKVDLLFDSPLAHPSVMMRKSQLKDVGLYYDVSYNGIEDYELWYRISKKYEIANIDQCLLRYRVHPAQVTQNYSEKKKKLLLNFKILQMSDLDLSSNDIGFNEFYNYCLDNSNLSAEIITNLFAFLDSIEHNNKKIKIYDIKTLNSYLKNIKYSILNKFPRKTSLNIAKESNVFVLPYISKRIFSGLKSNLRQRYQISRNRRKLKNIDFTIISNNCWGGIISEKYGLRKNSPTCGLLINGEDYIKFCRNLKYYISLKLDFFPFEDSKYGYLYPNQKFPVAKLGDIEVYFMHYANEDIAADKWYRRCKRINWNNIVYKISQKETFTKELIQEFMDLELDNKLCFCYDNIENAIIIPELKDLKSDETSLFQKYFDEAIYLNKIKKKNI